MAGLMNKQEAADYLGVNVRSIERYMSADTPIDRRLIPSDYEPGRGGKRPVFTQEALTEFKRRMIEMPKPESPSKGDVSALALVRRPEMQALAALLQRASEPPADLAVKVWLTRAEALRLTGLAGQVIDNAARAGALGRLKIGPHGAWAYRRSDVLAFAETFDGADHNP